MQIEPLVKIDQVQEGDLRHDRNRKMISQYEKLLKAGHSSRGAVSVLVREFRPISNRQVEKIVNDQMPEQSAMAVQAVLF